MELFARMQELGRRRGWHRMLAKWGSFGEQSLLAHSLTVASVAGDVLDLVEPPPGPAERRVALTAAFLHDIGKERDRFQEAVRRQIQSGRTDEDEAYRHLDLTGLEQETRDAASALLDDLATPEEVVALIRLSGAVEDASHGLSLLGTGPRRTWLRHVVWLADRIASIKSIEHAHSLRRGRVAEILQQYAIQLEWHVVRTVRGLATRLLHKAIEDAFISAGWRPVLFFPSGTLYLARHGVRPPEPQGIGHRVRSLLVDAFRDLDVAEQLGELAFGSVIGTVLPRPEYLFSSDEAVEGFWRRVRSAGFVKNPAITEEDARIAGGSRPDAEAAREVKAGTYLLIILKEIAAAAGCEAKLAEELSLLVGKDVPWHALKSLANNTPFDRRAALWSDFRPALGLKREERLARLAEFGRRFTLSVRPQGAARNSMEAEIDSWSEAILQDVMRPALADVTGIARAAELAYAQEKREGTIACVYCGAPPLEEPDVGEGAEQFYNLLPGGSRGGGRNKRRVCLACSAERRLRSLVIGPYASAAYLFPQVNGGRALWDHWQQEARRLVQGMTQASKVPLADIAATAQVVLSEGADHWVESFTRSYEASQEGIAQQIERFIQEEFPEPGDLQYLAERLGLEAPPPESHGEVARHIAADPSTLPAPVRARLERYLRKGIELWSHPNYILVTMAREPAFDGADSETSNQLAGLLPLLLLARTFLATCVVPSHPTDPVPPDPQGGYLGIEPKLGTQQVLRMLDTGSGVGVAEVDDVIRRLAALVLVRSRLRAAGVDVGAGGFFSVARMRPGRIIARFEGARKGGKPSLELVEWLKAWNGGKV